VPREQRKLAAIVADVVGYPRLKGLHENSTVDRLRGNHSERRQI